jgi:hypothetical protein
MQVIAIPHLLEFAAALVCGVAVLTAEPFSNALSGQIRKRGIVIIRSPSLQIDAFSFEPGVARS